MSLTKVLKKYVGIKLFEEEQDEFKQEFFKELFDPSEELDYSRRTTIFINGVLEDLNLPFIFSVDIENQDENHKGEWYWLLVAL